jgi:hypothetical protein
MDEQFSRQVAKPRFYLVLLAAFAGTGLILAAIGIYGVMSYTVARRTRGFGIRMALGAERRDILRLVLGVGTRLTIVGTILGIAGAYATTRLIASLLYAVEPSDLLTLACVYFCSAQLRWARAIWLHVGQPTRIQAQPCGASKRAGRIELRDACPGSRRRRGRKTTAGCAAISVGKRPRRPSKNFRSARSKNGRANAKEVQTLRILSYVRYY